MSFLKNIEFEINGLKFKCAPGELDQVKKDLQTILNKVTVKDIAMMKSVAESPVKLKMVRGYM